jgi:hypothetical protein
MHKVFTYEEQVLSDVSSEGLLAFLSKGQKYVIIHVGEENG